MRGDGPEYLGPKVDVKYSGISQMIDDRRESGYYPLIG